MVTSGYTEFSRSQIDISLAPIPERNFVRAMAMMAIPPEGRLWDVLPKSGLKPLMFNKHDGTTPCLGYLNMETAVIDEDAETVIIGIHDINTISDIDTADAIGIYAGGTSIYGTYVAAGDSDLDQGSVLFGLTSETYDILSSLTRLDDGQGIPVWQLRPYAKPAPERETTTTGEYTTTPQSTTTEAPEELSLVMDYAADWSQGMLTMPVPDTEMIPFPTAETTSRQYQTMSESCQWSKLCNATGISINMDTSNHRVNSVFSVGVISSGKHSVAEPMYWLLMLDDDTYVRIYLNLAEINYDMLGRYYLNRGQGHDKFYFNDPGIYGDISGTDENATFEITAPADSPIWANFWEEINSIRDNEPGAVFIGQIKPINSVDWYDCYIYDDAGTWKIDYTIPDGEGEYDVQNTWASLVFAGVYVSRTNVRIAEIGGEGISRITFDGETGADFDATCHYTLLYDSVSYDMWWDTITLQWMITGELTIGPVACKILIETMSHDTRWLSTDLPEEDLTYCDSGIYPEFVYYYRMKCIWSDYICSTIGKESWIRGVELYTADKSMPLPAKYGIYALSHYTTDEGGNQTRIMAYDDSANTRYCGIYGRNYLCRPADIYPDGLSIYPSGTEICSYYPPHVSSVLLSRANHGHDNYILYRQTDNTITFDLSDQLLGSTREANIYAYYDLQLAEGGSTLHLTHKTAGHAGNGFLVSIVMNDDVLPGAEIVIGPTDNKLIIYVSSSEDVTLLDLYGAIVTRAGIDYKITATLTGSGDGVLDVINESMDLTLSGGGDEMVSTNNPGKREVADICLHPGYIINTSRRKSPINMVGIYAMYLSANYAYSGNTMDVIPVETDQGVDLYLAQYMDDDQTRYALAETIKPGSTTYTDISMEPAYASCTLPTDGDPITLTAQEEGWQGNGITFSYVWLSEEEWQRDGYSPTGYEFMENIIDKTMIICVHAKDGQPVKAITTDKLIVLIGPSKLVTAVSGATAMPTVKQAVYGLSGGKAGAGFDDYYLHKDGYVLQLTDNEAGTCNIVRPDPDAGKWMFEGDSADLMPLKLQTINIGTLTKGSVDPGDERLWTTNPQVNYAAVAEHIATRKALNMINYLDIDGREVLIEEITLDEPTSTFTLTLPPAAVKWVYKALLSKADIECNIRDVYTPPGIQAGSITQSMIYYGQYRPRITVQIPDMDVWGMSLVPYYVIRLVYGSINS